MRWFSLLVGFAAGALALTVFFNATGRVQPGTPNTPISATQPAEPKAALPTLPAPSLSIPAAAPAALPAPPNPALASAPPEAHAMPVNTKLDAQAAAPAVSREIGLPLPSLKRDSIQDTFNDLRGGGTKHEATDILAPRGTPVMAVVEGNVIKLFNSKKGGTTVYQYDNQQKYCYYYAHLDRYAEGLKEGMLLRKGDTLGYVGTTGDAQPNNPHLHFAILELGADKHYYEHTTAVNPYPVLVHALTAK